MAGLSERYAAALLELALESATPESYREQAAFIVDVLQDDDCRRVLQHPNISSAQKQEFAVSIFTGRVNDDLLGFLCLAIAKNRERFLLPSLEALIERLEQLAGKVAATVVSARQLDSSQTQALQRLISSKLEKQVELTVVVDPTLIGGFYIHTQGHLIDCSVKRQLSQMKSSLQRRYADDFTS